jgi:hypothetical protein
VIAYTPDQEQLYCEIDHRDEWEAVQWFLETVYSEYDWISPRD